MDTKKLRQKILDLAIHGKLVPQDPNDEPASVFLERIRAEKERLISEGKIKRSRKTVKTSDTLHYEQDMPFEVPQGWVWTTLESCTINRDNERIPVASAIRSKQQQKKYDYYGAAGIIDKVDNYIFNERLLLVGEDGANLLSRAKNNAFFAEGKFWVNNHAHILDSYPKKVLDFVAIVINSMNLEKYISGSAQPKLSQDNLNRIPIPLPPLAEQQRIVAEIERWFSLIDTIEQGKENLQNTIKQTKNKILDLAIHGKLVPQDPSDEPASELLKRINPKAQITCDNEHYAQLPRGWSVISMQDICKLKDGIKRDNTSLINLDVKYLRGISEGNIIHNGKFVPANSYMFLVDGENSGEVFRTPIDGYQGSTFKLLDIDQNVNEKYILNVINLHRKTLRENKVGSAIPHLNKKLFKAIAVPLPPYNEQIRIVEAIKSTFNILDAIKENL